MDTKLRFFIEADASGVVRVTNQAGNAFDGLGRKVKQTSRSAAEAFSNSFRNIGSTFTSAGATLTAGLTLPLAGAGAAALKFAADAVESENLFVVSMGNMAQAARKWSEQTSEALGINEYELRKNVGTFNVMFGAMKIGEDAAYSMAKGMTQLAYDFASFYNLRPDEAFIKLQAGITGEAEPLKRLGILIDEQTVKTYAYTHGIAAQGEELTQQQKVLARYGSIMEQTSKAQGDLARTMDSPTNAVRVLRSQFEEMITKFGVALLPLATQILDDFIKPLVEGLESLVDWFSELPAPAQKLGIVLAGLAAAAGPVLLVLGGMATGLATLIPILTGPVGIVAAIVAVGGALAVWASKNETVMNAIKTAWIVLKEAAIETWDKIKELAQTVSDAISTIWEAHGEKIKAVYGTAWAAIKAVVGGAFTSIKGVIVGALDVISGIIKTFVGIVTLDWEMFAGGIKQIWEGIVDAIKGYFDGVTQVVAKGLNWLIEQANKLPGINIPLIEMTEKVNTKAKELDETLGDAADTIDNKVTPSIFDQTLALGETGTAFNLATSEADKFAEKQKQLKEEFEAALDPMGKVRDKIQSLIDQGFDKEEVVRVFSDEIKSAASAQIELHGKLDESDRKLRNLATGFSLVDTASENWGSELTELYGTTQVTIGGIDGMEESVIRLKRTIDTSAIPMIHDWQDDIIDTDDDVWDLIRSHRGLGDEAENTASRGKTAMTDLGNQVSTTLTNMTQDIAEKATRWAGSFQGFAKAAMSALLEGLFNPFINMLTQMGNALSNWLTGLVFGGRGGGGGLLSNLFGSLGNLFGGGGGGINLADPTTFIGPTLSGGGGGLGSLFGGLGGGIKGLVSILGKGLGFLVSNPIGWLIGGGVGAAIGITKLIDWLGGKNAWEAGEMEAARDFGGVKMSQKLFENFASSLGLNEEQTYPIRKDLLSSPLMLTEVLMPLAEEQGKMAQFIRSLQRVQTSWGIVNLKDAFESGMGTGDWSALNQAFSEHWKKSEISKFMPDWQTSLMAPEMDMTQPETGMETPREMMLAKGTKDTTVNLSESGNTSVDVTINASFDDIGRLVKEQIIPIIKTELAGGNTGLRDAIVQAIQTTEGAYA